MTKLQIVIKEFEPKYTQQIKYVNFQSQKEALPTLNLKPYRDYELEDIPKYFSGQSKIWVALINDKVVGTIAIQIKDSQTGQLRRLFVLPEYHGKRVGQKLLDHLLNYVRKLGLTKIVLSSHLLMFRARSFYEKNGFVKTAESDEENFFELEF